MKTSMGAVLGLDVISGLMGDALAVPGASVGVFEAGGDLAFSEVTSPGLCDAAAFRAASMEAITTGVAVARPLARGRLHAEPVRAAGAIVGSISVASGMAGVPESQAAEDERLRAQLRTAARLLGTTLELARAEAAVRSSEAHYRSLFESMLDGFAHCRMVFEDGRPSDFVFLEVNRAFEVLSGLKEVVGRPVSDVIPGLRESSPDLFEVYGRVASTGSPERFETFVESLGIWFDISVYSPEKGHFIAVFANVSERKRVEMALRVSEERFRHLFEHVPDVIYRYRLGPVPQFEYVSPAVARNTGHTPEEHYADPTLGARLLHPDDRPLLEKALRGELPSGEAYVARWIHKDGSLVWTEHRTVTIRDDAGRPVAVEGVSRDITQRIRDEEELRLRTRALEAAANAVVITDTQGRIQWVNPAFTTLTGYTVDEVVGQAPSLLKSGAHDGAFYRQLWQTILSGEVWSGEVVNRKKDGTIYTEEMTVTPVRSEGGQVTNFIAIKQDVTRRIEAEAARRESEDRFREIAENIQEVFWITDPDCTRLLYLSPAFEQVWGRTCASAYETLDSFVESIHPDDRAAAEAAFSHRRSEYDATYRITRPDGSVRWIHDQGFPVAGPGGEVVRMVGRAQDITALKETEQQLRLQKETLQTVVDNIPVAVNFFDASGRLLFANREFERLLGWTAAEAEEMNLLEACYPDPAERERVRDVMQACEGVWRDFRPRTRDGRVVDSAWANVRLSDGTILGVGQDMSQRRQLENENRQSQKMEAIGRLAGGVAHDFNNLLGVITGYSEMALRKLEAADPARAKIDQVLKAAARAAGLTGQLLAFSRRQVLAPKVVDLNAVLADLGTMLQRLIGEDVELFLGPGAGSAAVRVDPGQMEQVVMNLVVNARDAMPRGGRLTLETREVELLAPLPMSQGSVPPGPYAVLSVSDTGEGIDPANLPRIFEPFFTTKPLGEGTGLGLSTVYGIVRQSGGYVDVASAPGLGATFTVYLPRVAEEASAPAPETEQGERPGGDETILLVEDQEALREVIQETLQDRGYTLLVAESGEAALALAERHAGPIDLLLTDVVMPKLSGPDLAVRMASLRPDIAVLFMSGYTDDVLGRQGMLAQGRALIEKPFTSDALVREVRAVLSRREQPVAVPAGRSASPGLRE